MERVREREAEKYVRERLERGSGQGGKQTDVKKPAGMADLFVKIKSNLQVQGAVGAASTEILAEVDPDKLPQNGVSRVNETAKRKDGGQPPRSSSLAKG